MKIEIQRSDLVDKISGILSGKNSRTEVAAWAFNIIDDDSLRINDSVTLNYLSLLGAIDLPSTDRDYLYTEDDLVHWIAEIKLT